MLENKIKLKHNERIISVTRRYGATLFLPIAFIAILFLVPFFFMFWLFGHDWWGQTLFAVPVLMGIFFTVKTIFVWQRNIFVITTHRVINIDQRGFLDQTVSEVPYDQVEDVSGRVKGFWGTIFRFGDLSVQTGGGKVKIIVEKVKQPLYLQQEVNEIRGRHVSKYAQDFGDDVADAIIDKLYELELGELFRVRKVLKKRVEKLRSSKQYISYE